MNKPLLIAKSLAYFLAIVTTRIVGMELDKDTIKTKFHLDDQQLHTAQIQVKEIIARCPSPSESSFEAIKKWTSINALENKLAHTLKIKNPDPRVEEFIKEFLAAGIKPEWAHLYE